MPSFRARAVSVRFVLGQGPPVLSESSHVGPSMFEISEASKILWVLCD